MVAEVLQALELRPGAVVVDGTVGLAGHSLEMAAAIAPGGVLIGLDWDKGMLEVARERLNAVKGVEVHLFHTDYRALSDSMSSAVGTEKKADGILLDLGLNNAQIMDPKRGISFQEDGPLDMRMDRSTGEPASAWLNRASAGEIERALWEFGDERWARKIAQVIVSRRKESPLHTTLDLVDAVAASIPPSKRDKRIHFATRTFQAIRIAVNRELEKLQECLENAADALAPGGTMVVLSYHSGEDRAAKMAFRGLEESSEFETLYKKPLVPSELEVRDNPKSRSAKLRAIRRKS